MKDMDRSSKATDSKLATEVERLASAGAWCTPEFLVRSSQDNASIVRVGKELPDSPSIASGNYFATRDLLAGKGQVERMIDELRQVLKADSKEADDKHRHEVLRLWMSLESCVSTDLHHELFSDVLRRVFPGNKTPNIAARDCHSQLGGY